MENHLVIALKAFRSAISKFKRRGGVASTARLAYEHGVLIIESGELVVTVRAEGEWHGQAFFSGDVLKALLAAPLTVDPVNVVYADGRLKLGTLAIPCRWQVLSQSFVERVVQPGCIDLLAMDRSLPRIEVLGELAKKIRGVKTQMHRSVAKAQKALEDFEITEAELYALIEAKVQARLQEIPATDRTRDGSL